MGEMVHIRLDRKMREEIKKTINNNLFSSETEFIRDSIRKNLEQYQRMRVIHSLRGSVKSMKNTRRIPTSNVFRTMGLE